ncbi:MAG: mannose-6-phosphate isomerase, class I [Acidimicrobiales bacterium]|nr:mannose-6-phosphate isomerase, class I [Acidimicrobiales bacterium]
MDLLEGVIRSYDWGSTTALAELRGIEPSGKPEAELWFGAHKANPSVFRTSRSSATLDEMPFLVKVLAVDRPLSLQAHPDASAATLRYQREEKAGLVVDDPRRCHPDGRAKPEMVCAIGRFETLCGFRPFDEALLVAKSLGLPQLIVDALHAADWPAVVAAVLASSPSDLAAFELAVAEVPDFSADRSTADLVCFLAEMYPRDPSLLLVPLLRHVSLEDGDALFVAPGVLHIHLSGLAVEVMAVSDDVVRMGFTSKHVDPHGILEVIRPAFCGSVESATGAVHRFSSGGDAFTLWRLDGREVDMDISCRSGPELFLCTAGMASVQSSIGGSTDLVIRPGEAAWIGPDDGQARLWVDGTAYRVTVGGV